MTSQVPESQITVDRWTDRCALNYTKYRRAKDIKDIKAYQIFECLPQISLQNYRSIWRFIPNLTSKLQECFAVDPKSHFELTRVFVGLPQILFRNYKSVWRLMKASAIRNNFTKKLKCFNKKLFSFENQYFLKHAVLTVCFPNGRTGMILLPDKTGLSGSVLKSSAGL